MKCTPVVIREADKWEYRQEWDLCPDCLAAADPEDIPLAARFFVSKYGNFSQVSDVLLKDDDRIHVHWTLQV